MAHRFCVGSCEFLDSVGSACGVVHVATIFYHLRLCHIDKRIVAVNTFNCSSSSILQYIGLKKSQQFTIIFE